MMVVGVYCIYLRKPELALANKIPTQAIYLRIQCFSITLNLHNTHISSLVNYFY